MIALASPLFFTKIESLPDIEIVERIPIQITPNPYNENYLKTKKDQLGHLL
jgi:GTP cyclohydrolase II